MDIDEDRIKNSQVITANLIQAIEEDEDISSSDSLSHKAVKDNLPAICQIVVKAIAERNPLLISSENWGEQHGCTRSAQDFEPEEIAREFYLLRQIILKELKTQITDGSPEEVFDRIVLIDLIVNRITENSFQSYARLREAKIAELHQQIFLTNQEITRLIAEHQDSLSYLIHEIKNPLTSIIGYSDLFIRTQKKHDNSIANLEHIQQVLQQGRNVLRIINDALELSSHQEGNLQLKFKQIDIPLLIEDIVFALKPSIDAKKLDLFTSCIPENLTIRSDYLRIQQIITNLLANAIRYTSEGTIELSCFSEGGRLEIKVVDTGIGIAEEDCDRIFEPYFRTRQSQEANSEGLGLGLAITAQLVGMLKGTIKIVSEIDKGSTFIVVIPLAT